MNEDAAVSASKVQKTEGSADAKSELRKMSRKQRREAKRKDREKEEEEKKGVHCDFWVAAKHRYCKFQPVKGSSKCSVHQDDAEGDKERVPCPIDPNHSVYKRKLEKHVLVCSKTKDNNFIVRQPLYSRGCNVPEGKRPDPTLDNVSITSGAEEEEEGVVDEWLKKLDEAVRKLVAELSKDDARQCIDVEGGSSISEEVRGGMVGRVEESIVSNGEADKHDIQNSRLLSVMEKEGMLSSCDDGDGIPLFIEYGCGRGGLSRWVMEYRKQQQQEQKSSTTAGAAPKPWTFLLVDREARRNKQENRKDLTNSNSSSSIVMRLRMDIADLNLADIFVAEEREQGDHQKASTVTSRGSIGYDERLENLWARYHAIRSQPQWPPKVTCCIAKHLCGSATDLSLRTLQCSSRPSALIATCCHHRCEYDMLCGKEVLTSLLPEIHDPESFAKLRTMAGWATSHEPLSKEKRANISPQKAECGRLVKMLIDLCRVTWLKRAMKCDRVSYKSYVDAGVSPENRCIAAVGVA
ncbi:tRNA:m(4)X modification enzyme TRM13 [Perkinsus olseni]|uniref:tRNA:m(4)X modification enzyme TRM13 n=1 Tax=Perkinsus olseni TaxID=32597 RepID=A0A7J6LFM2_PEROL|nr:tRNA:m(4)X modification enzyme TRM13 [Perkinsus olseni]